MARCTQALTPIHSVVSGRIPLVQTAGHDGCGCCLCPSRSGLQTRSDHSLACPISREAVQHKSKCCGAPRVRSSRWSVGDSTGSARPDGSHGRHRHPGQPWDQWSSDAPTVAATADPENLSLPKLHSAPIGTFQYEARIEGLSPDTVYYYGVFNGSERLTAESPENRFQTQPRPGPSDPTASGFWVTAERAGRLSGRFMMACWLG